MTRLLLLSLLFTTVLGYDASLNLSYSCAIHCDTHRGDGWKGSFQFDCRTAHSSTDDITRCSLICAKCPSWVCVPENPYVFNCPATFLEGLTPCGQQCDRQRKPGSLDAFRFYCNSTFSRPSDVAKCHQDCDNCPRWVCDTLNRNVFHCPSPEYNGLCKEMCQLRRAKDRTEVHLPFSFPCEKFKHENNAEGYLQCIHSCKHCPTHICNPSDASLVWNCPSLKDAQLPPAPPPPARKYAGRCKERCSKLVNLTNSSVTFRCEDLYETLAERELCKSDCLTCPEDICKVQTHMHHQTGKFTCPSIKNHVGLSHPFQFHHPIGLPLVLAIIFCLTFISITIILAILYYKAKRGKTHSASQTPAPPPPPPRMDMTTQSEMTYADNSAFDSVFFNNMSYEVLRPVKPLMHSEITLNKPPEETDATQAEPDISEVETQTAKPDTIGESRESLVNQEPSPQAGSEVAQPEMQNNSSLEAADENRTAQPTPTEPDVKPRSQTN